MIAEGKAFINEEIRVEKEEYEAIYNQETFEDLEKMGLAISNFVIKKFQIAFFKKNLVTFSKINDQIFSEKLKIKVGDNVIMGEKSKSKEKSLVKQLCSGVVHKITKNTIKILFDQSQKITFDTSFSSSCLILKSYDNVTYQRWTQKDPNDVL